MSHTLFYLVAAHFILDYPLQGDTTAMQKSPLVKNALSVAVPWYYWLTAHALAQSLGVMVITGSLVLSLVELVAHWVIDLFKCYRKFNIHVDQGLHLFCKVLYALVLWKGWV